MAVSTDYSNINLFLNGQSDYYSSEVEESDDALGKDAFLSMMVAQLKNQDPLNPADGTDFTAQLAQFSSLEQQITTNSTLEAILTELASTNEETNLFNYIGKTVISDGNPVTVQSGEVISGGQFTIEEAARIQVIIYNSSGSAVRLLTSGSELISEGSYDIDWDCTDAEGYQVTDGEYTYDVIAQNSAGEYITSTTSTTGLVTGLSGYGGQTYLIVDDHLVDPSSVQRISMTEE